MRSNDACLTRPGRPPAARADPAGGGLLRSLRPLAIDVAIPLGTYYLLRDGLGLSLWLASVAGIGVSFATGDPRLMIAKDSAVSSVIGIAILVSVLLGRPLMTAGLKPWLTRGTAERAAAWARLASGSARFRRLEGLFSVIWGVVLLGECVARLIGAFTLPVPAMVWLGTVILLGAIGVATIADGLAGGPMIEAEAK